MDRGGRGFVKDSTLAFSQRRVERLSTKSCVLLYVRWLWYGLVFNVVVVLYLPVTGRPHFYDNWCFDVSWFLSFACVFLAFPFPFSLKFKPSSNYIIYISLDQTNKLLFTSLAKEKNLNPTSPLSKSLPRYSFFFLVFWVNLWASGVAHDEEKSRDGEKGHGKMGSGE